MLMFYSELIILNLSLYWDRFEKLIKNKSYKILPSPQIGIVLLLLSMGILVTFDIKIGLLKSKE